MNMEGYIFFFWVLKTLIVQSYTCFTNDWKSSHGVQKFDSSTRSNEQFSLSANQDAIRYGEHAQHNLHCVGVNGQQSSLEQRCRFYVVLDQH